jgi:hypothetical protein
MNGSVLTLVERDSQFQNPDNFYYGKLADIQSEVVDNLEVLGAL